MPIVNSRLEFLVAEQALLEDLLQGKATLEKLAEGLIVLASD